MAIWSWSMKSFKEQPPPRITAELKLISGYLEDKDWNDPKTYDYLVEEALALIRATVYARAEVVNKYLKG
jgi:hypothetical protein